MICDIDSLIVPYQTLFSSVPKPEYAVQDINLSFGHVPFSHDTDEGLIILEGRSASGKTTLLRLLAGIECPAEGRVSINGHETSTKEGEDRHISSWMKVGALSTTNILQPIAQPVILERKPDFDNSQTVLQRIRQIGCDAVSYHCRENNHLSLSDSMSEKLVEKLSLEFAQSLTMTKEQLDRKPSDLSPSSQFLFGIACGCMVSVACSVAATEVQTTTEQLNSTILSPIILFDELFDAEISSTVEKCKKGILNIVKNGAVVISVTHRPMYFMGMSSRCITLNGGKVFADRKIHNK